MKILDFLQARGLGLIIILFFILSPAGLFYDYSLNTGGDESVLTAATVKMITDHTLRPNYPTFYHVPLAIYFYLPPFILFFIFLRWSGIFTSSASLKEFGLMSFYNFLPFARLITVLIGLASVYLLYKISQKLFNNKWISLSAAFFLSSSFMFIQLTHLARVWLPQVMTILLAFYWIVVLYQRPGNRLKDYLLVGLSIGLAFGTHAIGLIVYSSFFVAHYLKNAAKKIGDIFLANKYFWLVNIIIILGYFLLFYLNPYGFKNYINRDGKIWPNFSFLFMPGATKNVSEHNGLFLNIIGSLKNFGYYADTLIEREPVLVLFSLAGAAVLFLKDRKKFYIIISFILFYYAGITFSGLTWYYILPLIPFLCLLAGYALFYLGVKIKSKLNWPAVSAAIFFIMILHLAPALAWDYLALQPSARLASRDWIYKNIPQDSRIIKFEILLELNENRAALADVKKFAGNFYTKKRDYLLSRPVGQYPQPNYYVLNYDYFTVLPEELLEKKYDYLIIGWKNKEELAINLSKIKFLKYNPVLLKRLPELADENVRYQDLFDLKRPILTALNDKFSGPIIDIYKLE